MKSVFNNKGFTLMELMIVVAIIGILVTLAIPNFNKMMPHIRLRGAVMDVSDVLQRARMKAVAKNKTYMVKFHYAPTNTFEMGEWVTGTTIIPEQDSSGLDWKGIDILALGSSADASTELNDSGVSGTVKFKSDGTASVNDDPNDTSGHGAVYLRNNPINRNEETRVMITEVSGKITVQHLAGTTWAD